MKSLVVYYSRTGCTRMAAGRIAKALNSDLVELKEQTERRGFWGFIKSGRDALRKKPSELLPIERDPADYDLVIAGSPVWAGTLCPAVRTFLGRSAASIRSAAFFCTHGGGGPGRSYTDTGKCLGAPLAATLALRDRAVKSGAYGPELDAFLDTVKAHDKTD